METYGTILLFAMPAFLLLVIFEKWYGYARHNDTVQVIDAFSSLSSGVTNVTKDVLGLSIIIISYQWLAERVAIIHIESSLWLYIIAFITLDFAGYWGHRISHEYNIFWNSHRIHHSSEEFNLACALRQSISGIVKVFSIFLLPAALLGVPEKVIAVVAPLHLFAQFWYHTRHIDKIGFLEHIIVTPSHHRVHHAINKEYIDKNYGQIFIVWDQWFGTFQEELSHVPPVYGITNPVRTWNPIKINFQHLWLMVKDAWRTKRWKDKFRIWLMPTGWRPADVATSHPIKKIENVYQFEKYDTVASNALKVWISLRLLALLLFTSYLFYNISAIGAPGIYLYGLFIFMDVYAFTDLADRNPYALIPELLKTGFVVFLISQQGGDWFGMNSWMPGSGWIIACYSITATVISAVFNYGSSKPLHSKISS